MNSSEARESKPLEISEKSHASFILSNTERLNTLQLDKERDWLQWNQRGYFRDLLCMWANATDNLYGTCAYGTNVFYRADEAISFGLYIYLEMSIAPAFTKVPLHTLYQFFTDFTRLDKLWAKPCTGFTSTIASDAMRTQDVGLSSWHTWLHSKLTWLETWAKDEPYSELMLHQLSLGWELGLKFKGDRVGLELALKDMMLDPKLTVQHDFRDHDPLYLMRVIYAAAAFSEGDLEKFFIIIAYSPGDTDTTASYAGIIVGALLGYEKLSQVPVIGQQLHHIRKFEEDIFNVDFKQRIDIFKSFANGK